jgi:hypothetical protein
MRINSLMKKQLKLKSFLLRSTQKHFFKNLGLFLLLFIHIYLIFYIQGSKGDDNNTSAFYSSGVPKFLIQSYYNKKIYDSADIVKIEVFLVGAGQIDQSQIRGWIPPNLISGDLTLTTFNFEIYEIPEDNWTGLYPDKLEIYKTGHTFTGKLDSGIFNFIHDKSLPTRYSEVYMPDPKTRGSNETDASYAPITIEFKINEVDTKGKDFRIELIFKYQYENKWYIDRDIRVIHIRSDIEKNAILITILSSLGIGLLFTILRWLLRSIEVKSRIARYIAIIIVIGSIVIILIFILNIFL